MIDFKKALIKFQEKQSKQWDKQGFCPAKLPPTMKGTVNGWRNNTPGVCLWEVRDAVEFGYTHVHGWVLSLVEGGVTGFESWEVQSLIDFGLFDKSKRFCTNAGGCGWDELYLDIEQIKEVVREVQKLPRFVEVLKP
ncbi:MAG: hypothetical protein AAGD09_03455 [Cyanobacteria bacterium P01_F01_bin.56]